MVYHFTRKYFLTYLAEVFGTSILGGLLAYPIATLILMNEAALFGYVLPFFVSTLGGTVIAAVFIAVLKRTKVLEQFVSNL